MEQVIVANILFFIIELSTSSLGMRCTPPKLRFVKRGNFDAFDERGVIWHS